MGVLFQDWKSIAPSAALILNFATASGRNEIVPTVWPDPTFTFPETSSFSVGPVVPIPTLPPEGFKMIFPFVLFDVESRVRLPDAVELLLIVKPLICKA